MPSITHESGIRHSDLEWVFQPERQQRFPRHSYEPTARQGLRASPRRSAGGGADRSALSSASDRANDAAEQRSSANVLTGAPITSDAPSRFDAVTRCYRIALAIH